MSLLNDILRDLSHHKPLTESSEGYDESLLREASFSQRKQFPWASLSAVFVVVFILVLAIKYTLHNFALTKSSVTHPVSVSSNSGSKDAEEVPAAKPETPAVAKAVVAQSEEGTKHQLAENEVAKSEELINHINDLFQQAERALGMDRLTAPVEDNAYGYYQKILSMDASNDDAKAGLDEIAKRYLAKAQEQFAVGNSQAADAFIQRARFVSSRYVLAHELTTEESPNNNITAIASEPPARIISNQPEAQTETTSETVKPFNVVEAKTLSVAPSSIWKDEQLVQHAQELVKQNKSSEALLALKNFISTEKNPVLSATLLADIYIQQGNTEAANIIADQATYLPVDTKSRIKAQILNANGKPSQAITLLEKNLPMAENNEAYRSLLASLYHQTANYQQSIVSYQRLIARFGDKPAYWLGLALAYDGLSQHKSALQAYQRLRDFPQLQEQVTQYTNQRIAALRSE
ncbi:MAG: hypothetical protein EOO52_00240 [Gammaproteobacteria bacterium]|nr:MAG: hypothetical protein EOO52_00240 [Gammaproteobacteria bacterium]